MPISIASILEVLDAHDIRPLEDDYSSVDLPGIGHVEEEEAVYPTSIADVLGSEEEAAMRSPGIERSDDPRIREWWAEIQDVIGDAAGGTRVRIQSRVREAGAEAPEPHCAWYCPIHFYGHAWGIYVREQCILTSATNIAAFVDWSSVRTHRQHIAQQLLRSAFYVFFLHEQFHHKVESLGLRLLIATQRDCYRHYKARVYRPSYLTRYCLEESLANAEAFRRLSEPRYVRLVDAAIREGVRNYLKVAYPLQPPGYAEGVRYISGVSFKNGLFNLQSQILDGVNPPTSSPSHWSVAPNMITALTDITDDIYVILPKGARPIFGPRSIDPGSTVSTRALEGALTRHHGYRHVPGGKGSHVKLAKQGAPTIVLPGNRPVLSPGVVKQALHAIGGYPLSRLPDLLDGRLAGR